MADRGIVMPRLYKRVYTNQEQMTGGEVGYPDGSNFFNPDSLVVLTGGNIAAVATGGTSCFGVVPDASLNTTVPNPPYNNYGGKHFPFTVKGEQILMNITDTNVDIGSANGAPTFANVTVGSSYGIINPTSGQYKGFQMLNVSDTTNTLVTVLEKPTGPIDAFKQDASTYNPLVLVEVIGTKIQAVS